MKLLFSLSLIIISLLTSCVSNYKVYEVSSDILKKDKGVIVFENDSLQIKYSFWENNGLVLFILYNKMNIPIYIDWKKSSLIVNEQKLDYWRDVENVSSVSLYNDYLFKGIPKTDFLAYSLGSSVSKTTKEKEERVTFVPPKAYIQINKFTLFSNNSDPFKKANYNKKDTVFEGESYTYEESKFNINNSLFKFRNFLTISNDEKFTTETYIDNEFYISKSLKMSSEQFQTKKIEKVFNEKSNQIRIKQVFNQNYQSPDRFFLEIETR